MHDWWLPGLQILNALIIGRSFSFSLFARDISVLSLLVRSLADRWGPGLWLVNLGCTRVKHGEQMNAILFYNLR